MTQKSTPAAGGNIDTTSEQRKFTKGMKWLKLGVDKDPEFGKQYFLYTKQAGVEILSIGELDSIKQVPRGKDFSFLVIDNENEPVTWPTHYCIPKPPID